MFGNENEQTGSSWFFDLIGTFSFYIVSVLISILIISISAVKYGLPGALLSTLSIMLFIACVVLFLTACTVRIKQPDVFLMKKFGKLDKVLSSGPHIVLPIIFTFEEANTQSIIVKGIDGTFSTRDEIQMAIFIEVNHQFGIVDADIQADDPRWEKDNVNMRRAACYLETKDDRDTIVRQKVLHIARDFIGQYSYKRLRDEKHKLIERLACIIYLLLNEEVSNTSQTPKPDITERFRILKTIIPGKGYEEDEAEFQAINWNLRMATNKSFTKQTGCVVTDVNVIDIQPADASLLAIEQQKSVARIQAGIAEDEGQAVARRSKGEAEAIETRGNAEANVSREKGKAKADVTRLVGDATAEAIGKREAAVAETMINRKKEGFGDVPLAAAEIARGWSESAPRKRKEDD